jgi:spore maturation protein CgeB
MIRTGWSPSVRLFEAAACGTPIISDRWIGLNELLPDGDAILIADNSDDVVQALSGVDAAKRVRIGATARDIVLAQHTGAARARELEQQLRHCMEQASVPFLRSSEQCDMMTAHDRTRF